jgi:hypothetical protein
MLPVLASRLWYADESSWTGYGDDPPVGAPRAGVEVIAYYHEPPYVTYAYGNWEGYHWREDQFGEWFASGPSLPDTVWAALRERSTGAARP